MKPTHIVVHCSDSKWGNTLVIDQWHRDRGWTKIGYHYVIHNGYPFSSTQRIPGLVGETGVGRKETENGSHCKGMNSYALGVVVIGINEYEPVVLGKLVWLLKELMARHEIPVENVLGHYETPSGKSQGKTCPNIDMESLRMRLR